MGMYSLQLAMQAVSRFLEDQEAKSSIPENLLAEVKELSSCLLKYDNSKDFPDYHAVMQKINAIALHREKDSRTNELLNQLQLIMEKNTPDQIKARQLADIHIQKQLFSPGLFNQQVLPKRNIYLVGHGRLPQGTSSVTIPLPAGTALTCLSGAQGILLEDYRNSYMLNQLNPGQIKVGIAKFSKEAIDIPIPSYANLFPQTALALSQGDQVLVPNYVLKPLRENEIKNVPVLPLGAGEIVLVAKRTPLSKLLKQYQGCHIHWVACTGTGMKLGSELTWTLKEPESKQSDDAKSLPKAKEFSGNENRFVVKKPALMISGFSAIGGGVGFIATTGTLGILSGIGLIFLGMTMIAYAMQFKQLSGVASSLGGFLSEGRKSLSVLNSGGVEPSISVGARLA